MARKSRKNTGAVIEAPVQISNYFPTAIYVRLSIENSGKDDDGDSIANQISFCKAYLTEHTDLKLYDIYEDNGEKGTNFDRPEFKRMMDDIRSGKVKCVLVKDLSRFGRDYIEAGEYLEKIFPFMGIRFISITDGYDSLNCDDAEGALMIPLKNMINDECHHATAETYKKIIGYFEPEFLLGLTATPERMDNQDVFELFDHNVPYELRLRDAIANDLVVPFKYFGIRDKLVDYGLTGNEERRMIAQMAKEDHCDFIAEQIEKHRPQGKLKALAFCRNVTHARMMCEALGERYHTAYLTGRNDIGERVRAYNDLQNDAHNLEILFTVDILNEGVDIPGVNMVLFLRPTESTTIFIQQLGRGLRKYTNKEYVTVLDFIGNSYKRSVQIAFALGSLSENFVMEKRLLASLVKDDFTALGLADYGVEIHIDDLSKEEILEYIDKENFNSLKYLKQDYFNFKKYIGSEFYPRHVDYINNDCAPDLIRFMSIKTRGKKNCSYYNFLRGIGEENLPVFTEKQIDFINYLSGLLPLVRVHEYQIVKLLLDGPKTYQEIVMYLTETVQGFVLAELEHVLTYLQFVEKDKNILRLSVPMDDQLLEYVQDLIEYGLIRYVIDNGNETGFKLWLNYRMDQVQLKLLKNPGNIMVGTYYYDDYVVIFASLKKDLEEADKLNYKDKFLQPDLFQWESMTNLPQSHLEKLMKSTFAHVFIRKMTTENGLVLPFTYVGKGKMSNPRKTDGDNGTYLFDIHMENELPEYLQYDFGLTKE